MSIYKTFVFMFYAIDAIYDDEPNDTLGNYLSGLNPFLFDDEGSADPAEYERFKESFNIQFKGVEPTSTDAYEFCKAFLTKNAPREALNAFHQTAKEDWIQAFDEDK